ncbi:MAG: amidohydrolase family protein [Planctomycetota bacterium]
MALNQPQPDSEVLAGEAGPVLIRAGAVCGFPGPGDCARPGGVVATGGRVVAAGPTAELERAHRGAVARVIDWPHRVVLPGMVNAHAHLQLTAIGPQPYTGDFISWVEMLRRHWPGDAPPFEKSPDETWFVAAVGAGARQSLDAGVEAVGDITQFEREAQARRDAGLDGISFVELFGHGPPFDRAALARLETRAEGFQPHAPYSAGPAVFAAAAASGRPVSCHLAETLDEDAFVRGLGGPFLDLLRAPPTRWSDTFAGNYGHGQSPVRWMEPYLRRARWLLAHCNYVDDDDLTLLAETGASVAYCPVASEYFGHGGAASETAASGVAATGVAATGVAASEPVASGGGGGVGHRYREMLEAGINVCLGTDSIVCQPAGEPQPLGILPQMRRLYRRDRADPALLLAMATTHGRRALGLDDTVRRLATVVFDPGDPVEPLVQVLRGDGRVGAVDLRALPADG